MTESGLESPTLVWRVQRTNHFTIPPAPSPVLQGSLFHEIIDLRVRARNPSRVILKWRASISSRANRTNNIIPQCNPAQDYHRRFCPWSGSLFYSLLESRGSRQLIGTESNGRGSSRLPYPTQQGCTASFLHLAQ